MRLIDAETLKNSFNKKCIGNCVDCFYKKTDSEHGRCYCGLIDFEPTAYDVDRVAKQSEVLCDNYCKWPETIEPGKEEELYKICDKCPLNQL